MPVVIDSPFVQAWLTYSTQQRNGVVLYIIQLHDTNKHETHQCMNVWLRLNMAICSAHSLLQEKTVVFISSKVMVVQLR